MLFCYFVYVFLLKCSRYCLSVHVCLCVIASLLRMNFFLLFTPPPLSTLLMIEYRYSEQFTCVRARARAIDCNFHKKNTRNLSFNLICVGIVSFLVKNNRVKPRERTLNDLSLENVATITFVDLMFMRLRFNDRCSFVAVIFVVVFCSDGHDLKLFLY